MIRCDTREPNTNRINNWPQPNVSFVHWKLIEKQKYLFGRSAPCVCVCRLQFKHVGLWPTALCSRRGHDHCRLHCSTIHINRQVSTYDVESYADDVWWCCITSYSNVDHFSIGDLTCGQAFCSMRSFVVVAILCAVTIFYYYILFDIVCDSIRGLLCMCICVLDRWMCGFGSVYIV